MDNDKITQAEISAILDSFVYLDNNVSNMNGWTLEQIVDKLETSCSGQLEYEQIKAAIQENPQWGKIELIDQSSTNSTDAWTDDLIQACTFKDADGNYYVSYRGTGEGRWVDNGEGMTVKNTEMQKAAADYFDYVAQEYLIEAHEAGKTIIVTGHSKGGNEAQYVNMAAEYEYLIDNCYSFDGQGFSNDAIETFKEKYGEEYYNEQLSRMFSICGKDDYVHDLGYVIIPEENTYFVDSASSGFTAWHHISYVLGYEDEDGNIIYDGINWTIDEDGNIIKGEQGEIGAFAKKLSENMMELDDEDLNGAATSMMYLVDVLLSNDKDTWSQLGSVDVDWTDYVDFGAHGLPAILSTLLYDEEGQNILKSLIKTGTDFLYDKYGVPGVIGGFAGISLALLIVVPIVKDVIVICNVIDFLVDLVDTIKDVSEKVKKFFSEVKDAFIKVVNKISDWYNRNFNNGYKYASENPQIVVDTYKLKSYAERIQNVNRRIINLDSRMDSLYWKVGLLDLWNLMQADLLTGCSWRLTRCVSYLNDTASDFESVENNLMNNM